MHTTARHITYTTHNELVPTVHRYFACHIRLQAAHQAFVAYFSADDEFTTRAICYIRFFAHFLVN